MVKKMLGYNGKILYIDMSASKTEVKDLDPKIAEDYIGGVSLSAKLIYDMLSDADYETLKNDPFSPVNPLVFATGPLTGTATPSSSRYSVSGISPLTGMWGESTSGGVFPTVLRKCGYDAVVITGESDKPKYIFIEKGEVQIKDADNIWGKDTRETIEAIKKDLGDDKVRVACIGKGGENLVKYAAVINDEGRAAGRCGLGAIMGKKKLKALVVKGIQPIEYADKDKLLTTGKGAIKNVTNAFASNFFSHYGTLCYTDMGMVLADVPSNYFTNSEFVAENLTGRALKEQYPVIKYACSGCVIGCGRTTIMEDGDKETEVDGPEYETTAAFGPLCGILEWDPILKANHLCNLESVDTISSGVSIAFLIYLVENKLAIDNISKLLSGINISDIKWGNGEIVLKLLEQIINREGIGDLLAEGTKVMAEKLGVDPGLAAQVKGLEIPMHDPRAYVGQALSYMTCCVGANHEKGDWFNIDGDAASYGKIRKSNRFNIDGREPLVKEYQDVMNVMDSACICNFPHLNIAVMSNLFKASTGFATLGNKKKMVIAGERGTNLKRVISCKLGITREDDCLPSLVTKALPSGGSAGISLDLEDNLKAFYASRGWDWETGAPTKEKLEELGI